MTIKTKLFLSSVFGILFVFLVAGVLVVALRDISRANQDANKIVALNQAISEARFAGFENIIDRSKSSGEQWRLKSRDITALLDTFPAKNGEEQSTIAAIRSRQTEIVQLFSEITATYAQTPTVLTASFTQSLQERLVAQLLIKQQAQIADTAALASMNQTAIATAQTRATREVLGALCFVLIMVSLNAVLLNRMIARSLERLRKGARAIAAGRLDYRLQSISKDEFGQVARVFNAMGRSLQRADQMKTQFIDLFAHQLRTPTGIIRWNVEAMQKTDAGALTAKQKQQLAALDAASKQITERIGELLTTLEIDAHGITFIPEACDPKALLDEVVKELRPNFQANNITLKLTCSAGPIIVHADCQKLSGALRKLIENAIMYSPNGSTVDITLRQTPKTLRFSVSDTGIGIPHAEQASIFDRFYRASNADTMMPDASGIGLYFAKHVVKAHGGTIGFRSKLNHGSTFWIDLPLNLVSATKPAESGAIAK